MAGADVVAAVGSVFAAVGSTVSAAGAGVPSLGASGLGVGVVGDVDPSGKRGERGPKYAGVAGSEDARRCQTDRAGGDRSNVPKQYFSARSRCYFESPRCVLQAKGNSARRPPGCKLAYAGSDHFNMRTLCDG